MRPAISIALLSLSAVGSIGCHQKPTPPPAPAGYSGQSLDQLEAEYKKLHLQYVNDCINGTQDKIAANRSLCASERDKMTPLGNYLAAAEQNQH